MKKKTPAKASPVAALPTAPAPEPSALAAKVSAKPKVGALAREASPRPSGLDAAVTVLSKAKSPMRIGDITKAAMDRKLWTPKGKTPTATLASAIGREIKDKGKKARFKKTGPGLFTVTGAKR